MAQGGDVITYTYSGSKETEDISSIGEITVDYLDGAGGETTSDGDAGSGGRVENAVVDVSNYDSLYLWVGSWNGGYGRYSGFIQNPSAGSGGGSTEISISNTDSDNSQDEPFLVGAGGGGGAYGEYIYGGAFEGGGGARGEAAGTAPPLGGKGAAISGVGDDGEAAVDDQNRGLVTQSGTTTIGGGSSQGTAGEIQITYKPANTAPSVTSGSESPTDGATGVSLDPTLSIGVTDADGDSMSVTFRDNSDGSKIGSTQTGIADGGTASVTWSGRDFSTSYKWYAVADDGSTTTTSSTFSFTTGDGIPQSVTVSDDTTEDELTVSWDEVTLSGVGGYYVYRTQTSGTTIADYTQIAEITSKTTTSYTDTGLENGERYYYRVSSHD